MLYGVNLLMPHAAGWIASRGDLWLMVFGMGFLLCLTHYNRQGAGKWLWAAAPLFFLALLAKESAVALLPVAAVMLALRGRGIRFRPAEWLWFGVLAVLFGSYYILRSRAIADAGSLSVTAFMRNLRSLAEETFKLIVPAGFSVMPGYTLVMTLAGIAVIAAGVFVVRRYKPSAAIVWTGLAIWLLPLLPSLAYEPSFAGVAYDYLDHRALFPFTGLALIAAGTFDRMKQVPASSMRVAFFIILAAWSGVNAWRIGVYRDWEAYYGNAMATNPRSGLAQLNYGALLRDAGRFEEALPHVQRGVEISPDYAEAHVRLAEIYLKLARYDESAASATRALELAPGNLVARQFRGSALGAAGKPAEAIVDFKYILDVDPYNASAVFNLGLAYKETNQFELAAGMFTQLIGINPKFPNVMFERGFCYGRMGMFKLANEDLSMSILMQPDHGPSYFFRGRAWEALGEPEKACLDWKEAAKRGVQEAEQYIAMRCTN
jgi:tetratricopeptide (TPR) repeat protein